MIEALRARLAAEHPGGSVELVETHISWVLLAGDFAYKVKKPVDLGFANFSTLERRRRCCEEELRLNRRTAPDLYLDVLPITGNPQAPVLGGAGEPFEFAVRMRRFPEDALLSNVLDRGELGPALVDRFARDLATFHASIPRADAVSAFGTPEHVRRPADANFEVLLRATAGDLRERIAALRDWSAAEFERRSPTFAERRRDGFVRECHGDAHLGNAYLDRDERGERVRLFDGIDFNADLRWIDVLSEAAFTIMDLADRGRRDLARRFRSEYLEAADDRAGLAVLPFYVVYRAMVRAKVAAIRLGQDDVPADERAKLERDLEHHVALAERETRPRSPRLLLMRGLSGSGKSTIALRIVEETGAIRVRSDVERKRLFGLDPHAPLRDAGRTAELYAASTTDRVYARLLDLARTVVEAGDTVVVDATFPDRDRREPFRRLARETDARFRIVDLQASPETLRQRVAGRTRDPSDADLAVLERQLARATPLDADELPDAVVVDTERPDAVEPMLAQLA